MRSKRCTMVPPLYGSSLFAANTVHWCVFTSTILRLRTMVAVYSFQRGKDLCELYDEHFSAERLTNSGLFSAEKSLTRVDREWDSVFIHHHGFSVSNSEWYHVIYYIDTSPSPSASLALDLGSGQKTHSDSSSRTLSSLNRTGVGEGGGEQSSAVENGSH